MRLNNIVQPLCPVVPARCLPPSAFFFVSPVRKRNETNEGGLWDVLHHHPFDANSGSQESQLMRDIDELALAVAAASVQQEVRERSPVHCLPARPPFRSFAACARVLKTRNALCVDARQRRRASACVRTCVRLCVCLCAFATACTSPCRCLYLVPV